MMPKTTTQPMCPVPSTISKPTSQTLPIRCVLHLVRPDSQSSVARRAIRLNHDRIDGNVSALLPLALSISLT